jgi:exopolyphosphatase/guanosine-5'-triphosphate,3'-diphosphate pyrophosphatase
VGTGSKALRLATVDVGTNTTLLLIAETGAAGEVEVLEERAEITRLGRGIGGDGRLGPEGIARTLAVLAEYAAAAGKYGASVSAVGTEALRRAPNAEEFLRPAAAILGAPVEVIDGEREAALSFAAALTSFPEIAGTPLAVVDIGGGSTEVIVSEGARVRSRASLPLGAVRLTETHIRTDPPTSTEIAALTAEVQSTLQSIPPRSSAGGRLTLVGTAGTVTTLCAMTLALPAYDASRVHGHRLPRRAVEGQIERLSRSTQAERECMAGLDPRRADVILAGAYILLGLARRLEASSILVSDRGIRWGLLHERVASLLAEGAVPR